MPEENSFKLVEKTLKKSQELMDKVRKQNEKWHGSGAFEKDITLARKLLVEMEESLTDVVAAFARGSFEDTRNQDIEMEIGRAYSNARSLMSHLYDDITLVHDALPKGQSQSGGIKAIEIRLEQLTYQCRKVRDHLRDTARIVSKAHCPKGESEKRDEN
jgi:hypothetical protein